MVKELQHHHRAFSLRYTVQWSAAQTEAGRKSFSLFSVGVLNINNIRDMKSDAANRVTVPLKLGEHRAKIYHTVLIVGGWVLMLLYTILFTAGWTPYLYIITLPLYAKHLAGVWKRSGREPDPMLPMLVISTFIFALLAGTGYILQ